MRSTTPRVKPRASSLAKVAYSPMDRARDIMGMEDHRRVNVTFLEIDDDTQEEVARHSARKSIFGSGAGWCVSDGGVQREVFQVMGDDRWYCEIFFRYELTHEL